MIVKNEEENILRFLNHHKKLANEIIVVDTGSTDNTKKICVENGAKVYDFEWCDDFSEARNESLKHATGDWILVLDADEFLSAKDMYKILKLSELNDRQTCYLLTQRHYTNKTNIDTVPVSGEFPNYEWGFSYYYQSSIARLFPNSRSLYFTYCVHEMIEPQAKIYKYRIVPTDIIIHHYGQIASKQKNKSEFYIRLGKKKIEENPEDPKAYYELGLEYNALGKHSEAAEAFAEAQHICNISEISCEHASAKLNQNELMSAKSLYVDAIKLNPYNFLAYVGLATVELRNNDLPFALFQIERAISLSPNNINALLLYAEILEKNGKPVDSVHIYKKLIKIDSANRNKYRTLGLRIIEKYRLYPGELDYVD